MPALVSTQRIAALSKGGGVRPIAGFAFLRGRLESGSFAALRGKSENGSYINLAGRVAQ